MRVWLQMLAAGLALGAAILQGQAPHTAATAATPRIDRVDPPNWWAELPSPMLLVRGEGFGGAHFSIEGAGVSLGQSEVSSNGHWAFLWLDTRGAGAQTVSIAVRNQYGAARVGYRLAARSPQGGRHKGFSPDDVLYLLMPDRFACGGASGMTAGDDRAAPRGWHGGNLAGIEQHLDYLKQLGVTGVWTTPVVSNGDMPDSYHGYAATDLYAVDSHFGTLADYRRLSDALHARGMKLVFDMVPNHIGVKNVWVQDPPAPDWLHGTLAHHLLAQYDFYQLVDPHAPERARKGITEGWFTDSMPDLNQENPLVAQYLIENAMWWIETANLDGIRLDTFPYVDRAFWEKFHAALHGVYPHLTTVGEIFHRDPEVTSFFAGGVERRGIDTGLDTPFDFPVFFAVRDVLAHDKPMTELAGVLRQDALYPHPERLATFIGNHDTTRFFTESGESAARLKLALGLVLTLRGMPVIYSGDEIGMRGGADPDNRHDFPGGFSGDARDAFAASGRTAAEQGVFDWTRKLIEIRQSHAELRGGMQQNLEADGNTIAFVRGEDSEGCKPSHEAERLLVIVNKGPKPEALDFALRGTALSGCTEFRALASTPGGRFALRGETLHVEEGGESLSILIAR